MPRLRLSTDHLKLFIWALNELGVSDVPSFKRFRETQDRLTKLSNVRTNLRKSPEGEPFYQNSIPDLLGLDWANPEIRPWIEEYPVRSTRVSESFHSGKWVEKIPSEMQAPMWADGGKHYYLGELAQLADGRFVIPQAWFRKIQLRIHTNSLLEISTLQLVYNCFELADRSYELTDSEGVYPGANPLREFSKGRRMYTSFVKAWGDDVSGNRSKQYNEHTNIYFAHANLPHAKLSQEYFVQFASTSPTASAVDQFGALMKDTEEWHLVYDCDLGEEIMIRIVPLLFPADNPQQSELCSHIGLKGNSWCRKCTLGGTDRERETDEVYHQHFSPSRLRTAIETRAAVIAQLRLAALGVAKDVEDLQTKTGVKDKLAERWIQQLLQRAREEQQLRLYNRETRDPRLNQRNHPNRAAIVKTIKETIQEELLQWVVAQPSEDYNTLPPDSPWRTTFRPGIHYNSLLVLKAGDIHADTPVEILHTYLLGADKYAWHHLHSSWKPAQHELFATRLRSASIEGLNIPPVRASYIVQYKNGLIGKHFKALQQLGIFQLDDALCNDLVFDLWRATGELGAMLWYDEIENMEEYLADLETLIANVLDIWSVIDPKRIFVKPKLHTLPHILADVRLHGPLILYATEIFECFNAVFRLCSVLSNHQAPSRDIAWTFADLGRFKHAVSGGWWKDESGRHVRAGEKVRQYFQNVEVQRRLGYVARSVASAGKCRSCTHDMGRLTRSSRHYDFIGTVHCKKKDQTHGKELLWANLPYLRSMTIDSIQLETGSKWFNSTSGRMLIGRIVRIMTPVPQALVHTEIAVVVVEEFTLPNSCHPRFNMPELTKHNEEATYTALLPSEVMFIVNVQHNCLDGKCRPTGIRRCVRERMETEITQTFIEHTNDTHYILNMHALHNARLIRKVLPRHLTKPTPYLNNRNDEHKKMAASLRAAQDVQRAKEAAARKERANARLGKAPAGQNSGASIPAEMMSTSHDGTSSEHQIASMDSPTAASTVRSTTQTVG
ncbi:uncharacterized protein B0H18DRAFT_933788 [Fomitopsis serialis]|uniref:uncharacterized protein n=1 Tax=Fomitopsis serialis TaxID=139415 RepID=UPI0020075863|nr:uncharacterized protein B0H18DRAFT_933788 [Neoantrodia serialis]KAH9925298.1 hypothetical protein B0H18DRAFT_933788 [Neoantrodia serialis]